MGLRDRLLYGALAAAFGALLGAGIAVFGFARVLRHTQGAAPDATVMHWVTGSAVLFGGLGLLRGDRAADTLGDVLALLTLSAPGGSRGGGWSTVWPLLWVGAGYLLIWVTRPGR